VAPHERLHVVPWPVLRLDGTRLFERVAVGVLPNLHALRVMDEAGPTEPSVALVGDPDYTGLPHVDPLPEAGPELSDLEQLYGRDSLVAPPLREASATQDGLVGLFGLPAAGTAILHVACHAEVVVDEPLASYLLLTGSLLDAAEILRARCHFPEVVLSACSTGWRPSTVHGLDLAGDDALGLVASFLEAGARAMVVSLSKANDQVARQFMVTYHSFRRSGLAPAQALRRTQQQLVQEGVPVWAWAGMTAYSSR